MLTAKQIHSLPKGDFVIQTRKDKKTREISKVLVPFKDPNAVEQKINTDVPTLLGEFNLIEAKQSELPLSKRAVVISKVEKLKALAKNKAFWNRWVFPHDFDGRLTAQLIAKKERKDYAKSAT